MTRWRAPEMPLGGVRRLRRRTAPTRRRSAAGWALAVVVVALAACGPAAFSAYTLFQLELILVYLAAAAGLNLAIGYSGEFLLCQATVLGVSAYTAGVLSLSDGWSPLATLPVAIAAGVVWQLIISVAGLRVRGLYLGLLSFFSVLVFPNLISLTGGVTGGSLGLVGIPPFVAPGASGSTLIPYEIALATVVASVVLVRNLVSSGWGIRLRYLRDAPHVLPAVGIRIETTKLTAYVFAAVPAGIGGWAFGYLSQSLTASVFDTSLTLILFAGVQMIAPGTILGPLIGAGLLEGYSQLVGPFSQYNVLGLGLLLTATLVFLPGGVRRLAQLALGRDAGERPWSPSAGSPAGSVAARDGESRAPFAARGDPDPDVSGGEPVLEVHDVVKTFGGNRAVAGASFSAQGGRIVALMGENGSGKTTLVNLISGVLAPDQGEIRIAGRSTAGLPPWKVARLGCSRTFQVPQVVGELTVRENVEAALLRSECSSSLTSILLPFLARRRDRRRRLPAAAVCRTMGFSEREIDTPVATLPLGQRRLVEVTRAIATAAEVMCLDEPSAGLNDSELVDLAATLNGTRRPGQVILLVEHNVRFVLDTCDDIILLREGQVEGVFRDVDADRLAPPLQRHLRTAVVGG